MRFYFSTFALPHCLQSSNLSSLATKIDPRDSLFDCREIDLEREVVLRIISKEIRYQMVAENSSNSTSEYNGGGDNSTNYETEVVLNVYDLTPINQYSFWVGCGIFHSGIEVHGMEYGYGAHDYPISGVFEVEPKSCPGFIYRCSIPLGRINMPPAEFRMFIERIATEYHGDTYHLISKNCNHFTDDVSWRLTGKGIPGWVNRLARLGALCSCLLPESLQVSTVKQLPEYHACTEDGSESSSTISPHEPTESDDGDQDKLLLSPSAGSSGVAFIKEAQRTWK
ncbi:deSI-like protein At4g17486 isoform X2 [Cornus florida]|uniref:deSI-like protein At4g17486 isoform X2 n=1 Tax=Cornus florida TaxID=4283 RepID=UPI00289A44F4|nr:deSI-like protein At4g17486 isoform X2 [Cornus florida]